MPAADLSSGRARSALSAGMALAALTVLAVPANLLLHSERGADGAAVVRFDERWSTSLLFFGEHLGVLAYVLARNAVPVLVVAATAAAGLAYLADSLPDAVRFLDSAVLVPLMVGQLALLGWLLLRVGQRSITGRRSALMGR